MDVTRFIVGFSSAAGIALQTPNLTKEIRKYLAIFSAGKAVTPAVLHV